MKYYIGIDLGTSAVKLLLLSETGVIRKTVSESYSVSYPHTGWSEQDPELWVTHTLRAMERLLDGEDRSAIRGISTAGQMHGLVLLDQTGAVLRPAILWNDSRSVAETEYLNTVIGREVLSAHTGNIAFPGFTLPKLLWVKANEPEIYARVATVLLPKDYLVYRLTGVLGSEPSDACGTLYYDVKHQCWSKQMLDLFDIPMSWMPPLRKSDDIVGRLQCGYCKRFGLSEAPFVTAGAGDNAGAALGTGALEVGTCNISLGTSGTVLIPCDSYKTDPQNALHTFVHADGACMLLGCILSAASCGQWWIEEVLNTKHYAEELQSLSESQGSDIVFLPYLMGERSPHNDPYARGVFIGMSRNTSRGELTRAVYEGVTFALRDCIEVAKNRNIPLTRVRLCGGGAVSQAWQQMTADILGVTVEVPVEIQGPSLGAALLAAKADGVFPSLALAAEKMATTKAVLTPDPAMASYYEGKYRRFQKLYQVLRPFFSNET